MRKSSPGTPRITAPPPSSDVAPHSLLRMCAVSWHSTAPHGGHSALSDRALAAVPLVTGNDPCRRMLEHLAHDGLEPLGQLVAAVGERRALLAGDHGVEDLGNDAGGVVGTKLDLVTCILPSACSRTLWS